MKLILTYLFSLTFVVSYSQTNNFAPIGARWYYDDYVNSCPTYPNCGYFIVESIKDTLVLGQECRLLQETYFTPYIEIPDTSYIVYEDSGIVYLFNNGQFHTLYDFNADVEDTIKVFDAPFFGYYSFSDYEFSDFTYIIETVETLTIDGQDLICQTAKSTDSDLGWGFWQCKIYEKIGCLGELLGRPNIIPLEFGSFLRCYEDGDLSYQNPSYLNQCDFITGLNNTLPEYFDIQPNPVVDVVHCTNNSFFDGNIVIYNLLGSLVYSGPIQPNTSLTIDLSKYAGFMIAVVHFSNSQTYSFNILKM